MVTLIAVFTSEVNGQEVFKGVFEDTANTTVNDKGFIVEAQLTQIIKATSIEHAESKVGNKYPNLNIKRTAVDPFQGTDGKTYKEAMRMVVA